MADYITQYSGQEIDEAIGIALDFKNGGGLDSVGVTNLTPTGSTTVVDLNSQVEVGSFIVSRYSNGPAFSPDHTTGFAPVEIIQSEMGDNVYQFFNANGQMAYRYRKKTLPTFGGWIIQPNANIVTTTTLTANDEELCTKYAIGNIDVKDKMSIIAIMCAPNADGAKISTTANLEGYPIYTADGNAISANSVSTNSYLQLFYSEAKNGFYAIGASSSSVVTAITNKLGNLEVDEASNIGAGCIFYNSSSTTDKTKLSTSTVSNSMLTPIAELKNQESSHSKVLGTNESGTIIATTMTTAQASTLASIANKSGTLIYFADRTEGVLEVVTDIPPKVAAPATPVEDEVATE